VGDRARPGIGRLALESGAPVVPIAVLGSHHVRNWRRLQFPRIRIQYGIPFRFAPVEVPTREQQQRAADLILERIRSLHDELAAA
jgi:1-acyl-sn-glycerol-3-phosphate acyltransferase